MPREWTGSCANLPDSLRAASAVCADHARETNDERWMFLAYSLGEWADATAELYARLDAGAPYTNAQGVALAQRITDRTVRVEISTRPFDLPNGYLLVNVYDAASQRPFQCGIAPDGSVSS